MNAVALRAWAGSAQLVGRLVQSKAMSPGDVHGPLLVLVQDGQVLDEPIDHDIDGMRAVPVRWDAGQQAPAR